MVIVHQPAQELGQSPATRKCELQIAVREAAHEALCCGAAHAPGRFEEVPDLLLLARMMAPEQKLGHFVQQGGHDDLLRFRVMPVLGDGAGKHGSVLRPAHGGQSAAQCHRVAGQHGLDGGSVPMQG